MAVAAGDLCAYEVRMGGDGKWGIYLRDYNVRVATFAANSRSCQEALKIVFERAEQRRKADERRAVELDGLRERVAAVKSRRR